MSDDSTGIDYSRWIRPELDELQPYRPPPATGLIRLDANEAPDLLSDTARKSLAKIVSETPWRHYPDAAQLELKTALAAQCNTKPDNIVIGAGSDEIIVLLLTALSRAQGRAPAPTMVTVTPTFGIYRLSARARGWKVVEVPLDKTWDLPLSSLRKAIELANPNLVFIASPNNPTGNRMDFDGLRGLIDGALGTFFVVDEAYVAYAQRDHLELLGRPNVAIMRTFSKVGFAALRVGWLAAPEPIAYALETIRPPYNVSYSSLRAAEYVARELGDEITRITREVVELRKDLSERLLALDVDIRESEANFIWVDVKRPAAQVWQSLRDRGVLAKRYGDAGRLASRLRVTVGQPAEHDRLIAALKDALR